MSDDDKMTEEEAIAKVLLMEEEYHHEAQTSHLKNVRRICFALIGLGMLILITLFPLILIKKDAEFPVVLIVFSAGLIAGGNVGLIWERMQESKRNKDPFDF